MGERKVVPRWDFVLEVKPVIEPIYSQNLYRFRPGSQREPFGFPPGTQSMRVGADDLASVNKYRGSSVCPKVTVVAAHT